MRVRRGFLGWGVFLLLVGAVPLAVRAGYLANDQIRNVGSLWPLILIGIGVGILLARTRFAFVGGLLVAATVGAIVGGLLSGGVQGFAGGGCGPGAGTVAFPTGAGTLAATSATVELDLNCGEVTVATGPGTRWQVQGEGRDGTGPLIDADDASLRVRSRDADGPLGLLGERDTWRITLPDAVRLDLDLALNAGSSTMDLGGATLGSLRLDLNAGSITADLGSVRALDDLDVGLNAGSLELTLPNLSVRGAIEANAGSVSLCVPPGAALRLRTGESVWSGYDYDGNGLLKRGSVWETPGFDTAAVRIELDTRANAGSFSLNPEDGCGG